MGIMHRLDALIRRKSPGGMVKTATGQNGDKSKRRQTKTATGPK